MNRHDMGVQNTRLINQVQRLEEQLERVRELHKEVAGPSDDTMCEHCSIDERRYFSYPCPTIKALDGEQE